MPRIEYKCGCEDITAPSGQSSVKTSNPASSVLSSQPTVVPAVVPPAPPGPSKKAPVEAALKAANEAVNKAIAATGGVPSNSSTTPISLALEPKTILNDNLILINSIEDKNTGLVKMTNDLVDAVTKLGDNDIIVLLNHVKEAIDLDPFESLGMSITTDLDYLKKNNTLENLKSLFGTLEKLKKELEAFNTPLSKVSGGKRKHTRRKHCKHGKNIMHCPYCKHRKHSNKSKKGKKRSRRTRKLDRIARSLERSLEHSLNKSSRSKKSKRSRRKSK